VSGVWAEKRQRVTEALRANPAASNRDVAARANILADARPFWPTLSDFGHQIKGTRSTVGTYTLTFVKEDLRMFTPPSGAALPIFTDEDSKPYAGATVAVFTARTQRQHTIIEFVAC
jgi:hypothetical protein